RSYGDWSSDVCSSDLDLDPRLTQGRRPAQMVGSAPSRAEAVRRAGEFDGWHTDDSFTPELPRVGTLRCEVIPPVGGDTVWTSLRSEERREGKRVGQGG